MATNKEGVTYMSMPEFILEMEKRGVEVPAHIKNAHVTPDQAAEQRWLAAAQARCAEVEAEIRSPKEGQPRAPRSTR